MGIRIRNALTALLLQYGQGVSSLYVGSETYRVVLKITTANMSTWVICAGIILPPYAQE